MTLIIIIFTHKHDLTRIIVTKEVKEELLFSGVENKLDVLEGEYVWSLRDINLELLSEVHYPILKT